RDFLVWPGLGAQFADHDAIHAHPAAFDEGIGLATGAYALFGHEFRDSYFFHSHYCRSLAIITGMDAHKFLPTRWTAVPPASLPLPKRQWLLRPGALTNGLRQQGNMLLRVMGEWAWGLSAIEACMLQ